MSRCFPFPPPGYEKKSRNDETDLLAKEKHKEKRHKKDKKDKDRKEKRERKDKGNKEKKDKKEKDRSKEKHKDKRDKKEKHKDKDKSKERSREKNKEETSEEQTGSSNGEKLHPNKFVPVEPKESKYVLELAKRIRDVDCASRSHFPQNSVTDNEQERNYQVSADERKIKVLGPDAKFSNNKKLEEKIKESKNGHQKENGPRNHISFDKSSVNLPAHVIQRTGSFSKPLQNEDSSKQIGGKEKNDLREKHKHKDRDRGKDDKSKSAEKVKRGEEEILKLNISTKEPLDFRNSNGLGKRKEPERNGFFYDNETRPNKCAKISELLNEQKPPVLQSETHDVKRNGFLANGDSSSRLKPPHPDAKYLNQILNIPKVDDIPDSLDEEWLFSSDWRPRKKQNLISSSGGGSEQVWAEAMRIDSGDIVALPYVIPY